MVTNFFLQNRDHMKRLFINVDQSASHMHTYHGEKNVLQYIIVKTQLIRVFNLTLSYCNVLRHVIMNLPNFSNSV